MSTTVSEHNIQGLTEQEARERLAQHGYNELPSTQKRSLLHMVLDVLKEPMFMLLIVCGLLYLLLGDKEEAPMLMGFLVIRLFYKQNTQAISVAPGRCDRLPEIRQPLPYWARPLAVSCINIRW